MIEINLLPPDMRKVDRTSLKRLLAVVAAVVLFSGSAIGVTISLRSHHVQSTRNASATAEVARAEKVAREYDVLQAELSSIETRLQTIEEIRSTRMRWGRKLDELYAILPDYVWFEKLELKTTRAPANQGNVNTLVLDCYLAGSDEKRYAEFRRVLTGEVVGDAPLSGGEFFGDFASLGYSGWSREEFKDTEEGVALKFSLELPVKSAAPAPAAPKPVVRPAAVAAK